MNINLPVILLKHLVLLPYQEVKIELNNNISKKVISIAGKYHDDSLLVVCPTDQIEESPEVSDLPYIGVVGKIKSKLELPNGNLRVVLIGLERVRVLEYKNYSKEKEVLIGITAEVEELRAPEIESIAFQRKLMNVLVKYINSSPRMSNSIMTSLKSVTDLNRLTDMIGAFLPFSIEKKNAYMIELDSVVRAEKLIRDISIEIEVLLLDEKLDVLLQNELEGTQKEYIIKEKIKKLKNELGEGNFKDEEISLFNEKLSKLNLDKKTKEKLVNEIKKYELTSELSPESANFYNYLDWILNLPWNHFTKDESDLNKIKASLDESHFGLEEVKNRIIEYIAIKKKNPKIESPILCFVGPPGVGKSTLAKSIAASLNKEFYKISVGGLNDASELLGHRRTYIGASPGKIIQAIKKLGSNNGLILIDEVDKMVKDYKGDPASALLDILDSNQNKEFVDNYLEEPFDLSKILFILTANSIYDIPSPLYDRLEIIELSSYSEFDKLLIAKNYLIPRIYSNHLIKKSDLKISDSLIQYIINKYTKESGVRELERQLSKLVRKIVTKEIKTKRKNKTLVNSKNINEYLGLAKYDISKNNVSHQGIVNGLAYTTYGGMVMPIEVCLYSGKGDIILTGSLGPIMKESAQVALSYIKANYSDFLLSKTFDNFDLHLHALEGAVNKEGPSGGITIVSAILSLLLNKKISSKIAMSGEITLNGEVLKVGGIKEKIIGAYNSGIKEIYIPLPNQNDLEEVPKQILKNIKVHLINNYKEIINNLFKS